MLHWSFGKSMNFRHLPKDLSMLCMLFSVLLLHAKCCWIALIKTALAFITVKLRILLSNLILKLSLWKEHWCNTLLGFGYINIFLSCVTHFRCSSLKVTNSFEIRSHGSGMKHPFEKGDFTKQHVQRWRWRCLDL